MTKRILIIVRNNIIQIVDVIIFGSWNIRLEEDDWSAGLALFDGASECLDLIERQKLWHL